MPYHSHRDQGPDPTGDNHRDRQHGSTHDEPTALPELDPLLQRTRGLSAMHAGALARIDGGSRLRMITTLQRTLGNTYVQRLIAGIGQPSAHIHRCGGTLCNCASDDDGIGNAQRLGQPAVEEQAPRSSSLAAIAPPPRREEDETRPPTR